MADAACSIVYASMKQFPPFITIAAALRNSG
jgi:hypothetical protein